MSFRNAVRLQKYERPPDLSGFWGSIQAAGDPIRHTAEIRATGRSEANWRWQPAASHPIRTGRTPRQIR